MTLNRDGELGSIPIRSDRFFSSDADWYFSTREGTAIGPFGSKKQAGKGLDDFLEFLSLATPKTLTTFFSSLTRSSV